MGLYEAILADAPITYWPMTEVSGAPQDVSVNGRAASYTNAPSQNQTMLTGPGVRFNNTLSVTNQDLTAVDIAADNITTGTVECWANIPSQSSGTRAVVIKEGWWGFYVHNGFLAVFDWAAGTWRDTAYNPADGSLHHWVFTFNNGATGTFYRDAVSVATVSSTGRAGGANPVTLANNGALANALWATMGHVAIYGSVLSAGRIGTHYQAGIRSGVALG